MAGGRGGVPRGYCRGVEAAAAPPRSPGGWTRSLVLRPERPARMPTTCGWGTKVRLFRHLRMSNVQTPSHVSRFKPTAIECDPSRPPRTSILPPSVSRDPQAPKTHARMIRTAISNPQIILQSHIYFFPGLLTFLNIQHQFQDPGHVGCGTYCITPHL